MNNIQANDQAILIQLSSTFSKILKKRFGKGPESCFVYQHSNSISVHIRNFSTPAEDILTDNEQLSLAYKFRRGVMDNICSEFANEANRILGLDIDSYFDDWDYIQNTGILFMTNSKAEKWLDIQTDSLLKEKLHKKIYQVSSKLHKVPEGLAVHQLSQRFIMVEGKRVMLQIENMLVEKGHFDILEERSREIKKNYQKERSNFEMAINERIDSFYMVWDYKKDRFFLFFYLQ